MTFLTSLNQWVATAIINFIGGLIFFWIDRLIFTSQKLNAKWEIKGDAKYSIATRSLEDIV